MSESLTGGFGQPSVEPPDPTQRVERMDRDSSDRDRRQQEEFGREPHRAHHAPPEEDRVEISEEALQALKAANQAVPIPSPAVAGVPPADQETLSS